MTEDSTQAIMSGRITAGSRVISNRIRMAVMGACVVPATKAAMPTTA